MQIGQGYRVHGNGSLIFRSASKSDEGWFRCRAENGAGSVQSEWARLVVEGEGGGLTRA